MRKPARRRFRGKGLLLGLVVAVATAWLAWTREWIPPLTTTAREWIPPLSSTVPGMTNTVMETIAVAPELPRPEPLPAAKAPVVPTVNAPAVPATESTPSNPPAPTRLRAAQPPAPTSTAVLEAQIALDRLALSPGSIDGLLGSQTRAAIRAFQVQQGLPVTGELDPATRAQLPLVSAPIVPIRIENEDVGRLLPLPVTWLGKAEQPRLDYESVLELVAERSHAHPKLIRRLNPDVDWSSVWPGTIVQAPGTTRVPPQSKAALVRIRLGERTLQAFDSYERLLAHFPCSIAARVEKRPIGELRVVVVVPNPDYLFKPENFPESAEAQMIGRKLRLNPGPNNPVGTAWIGLNLAGYGIHGTPRPEEVGRTESHGCFRLANWNAEYLARLVTVGTPIFIEP